ncbi:MAG: stage II sporulation protein R [Tissierellia bacterium]|nr:stage II sporulation protein R [Tissierellia bacterium]
MQYYKKILISALLVVFAITIAYSVEAYTTMAKLNNKLIRLHVVANSDSVDDQQLKYKVRNQVITSFNEEFENVGSKEESEKTIIEKIHLIRSQAEKVIKDEGYGYDISVYYGNYKFPRKVYEEIVLPEGYYDAVRIEIGQGEGNNWWCVMFPPMCFLDFGKNKDLAVIDIETEEKLQEILSPEEIESIKTKRGIENIKLKSKIFEFVEKGRVEKTGITAAKYNNNYAISLPK